MPSKDVWKLPKRDEVERAVGKTHIGTNKMHLVQRTKRQKRK